MLEGAATNHVPLPSMKALLLSQYNQLDLADLPAPEAGPDEILVRVAACGICGSDVHGYDGTSGSLGRRRCEEI
jgi:D-arabinose 1-dehydrogenase-like Zn-dependent alcohol dehydrogenase